MPVKDKGRRSRSRQEETSGCSAGLTPLRGEKKGKWLRRAQDCSTISEYLGQAVRSLQEKVAL